ncbi:MAG: Uma2 family endonuclease [Acidobacteriota bacterium]
MSTAIAAERLLTGEDLFALGDIGPCELIDGRIVHLSPTGEEHANIEFILGPALAAYVRERNLGRVVGGEVGIYTRRGPDRVRGADIAFISKRRASARPEKGFLQVAPDLVVEIVSPTDRWQDVRQKVEEYFAIGVDRVWVVEPENRAVVVFRSAVEMQRLGLADTLRGEGDLAGFAIPVADLFQAETAEGA